MFTGLFEPAFLQAACAHVEPIPPTPPEPDGIVIRTNVTGDIEPLLSCTGSITIKRIYEGVEHTDTYTDLNQTATEMPADADTDIVITGKVTYLATAPMVSNKITSVRALNSQLQELTIGTQNSLTTLCLPTTLTSFSNAGLTGVTKIMYPANNNSVSTAIKNAITNATADDGEVYLDADGAYYSTIADAATAKGWTIKQL